MLYGSASLREKLLAKTQSRKHILLIFYLQRKQIANIKGLYRRSGIN